MKTIGGVPFRVMSFVTAIKRGKMPYYMLLAGTVLDHTEYDFAGVVQAIQNRSYKAQVAEVNATLQSLRILNAHAAAPPATLLTLSGTGEKQSDTFKTSAPFQISWDTKFDGIGAFSIVLYADDGLPIALIANTLYQVSRHQTIVHDDCSRGCYLKVTAVGVHWTIAVTA